MKTSTIIIISSLGMVAVTLSGLVYYYYKKQPKENPITQNHNQPPVVPTLLEVVNNVVNTGKFKEGDCVMADGSVKVGLCGSTNCSERDSDFFNAGQVIGKFLYEAGGYYFFDGGATTIFWKGEYLHSVYTTKKDAKLIKAPQGKC
jgi:hypothetical protein